ncbi:MAG TPA: hypothetical protein VEB20_08370 [Azospirillaceae bacterium]|nr:hypothetical protein [Azospirillaceae bacterium]
MAVFENPMNGYREEVSGLSVLWTLLFGCFYFMFRGAWGAAVLSFLVVLALGSISFGILGFLAWIIIALCAPAILRGMYLRRGWREVAAGSPAARTAQDDGVSPELAPTEAEAERRREAIRAFRERQNPAT